MENKAIFLDRDGTIIKDKKYLYKKEEIELLKGTIEGLKKLQKEYLLIIITNQSGVAKGYFTENNVNDVNKELRMILSENGILITDILYCPHHINGIIEKYAIECDCRKPKTGMIEMAKKQNNINLSKSYVVGDKDCDILLAKNAKLKSFLICNENYNNKEIPDYYANNLDDVYNIIIKQEKK